jgi:hypothetical protein
MSYILFLVLKFGIHDNNVVIKTQRFKTEVGCLQTIDKMIDIEKKLSARIYAFCMKDV